MAENTETKAETKTAAKQTDYFEKIGRNFNPKNARELFGDNWVDAMNAVSRAGGYGVQVTEAHADLFDRHLFGGFAIPQGGDFAQTRSKINTALNGVK